MKNVSHKEYIPFLDSFKIISYQHNKYVCATILVQICLVFILTKMTEQILFLSIYIYLITESQQQFQRKANIQPVCF